jgi:hypothetical protein
VAIGRLCDAALKAADRFAQIFKSRTVAPGAAPTSSQDIAVIWRRSASR